MTLIISAQAEQHIVVTADGLCRGKFSSSSLQKIFPLPNKGLAVAHHGQNIIAGYIVKDMLQEFLSDKVSKIRITTVQQIARLFVETHGEDIRKTLDSIPGHKLCGLLFLGFGRAMGKSKIYEVYWEKGSPNIVTPKEHHELVLSGDAKKYIKKDIDSIKEKEFRQKRIIRGEIQDAFTYSNKWYKIAEDRQAKAGENIFGGYKHQLLIEKAGCTWLIPPNK